MSYGDRFTYAFARDGGEPLLYVSTERTLCFGLGGQAMLRPSLANLPNRALESLPSVGLQLDFFRPLLRGIGHGTTVRRSAQVA